MKKILFVCLMAALGLGTGSAAAKDAKKASTVTTVFKTDIDCEHCAKRIMDNIPFEKGVKDVKVDVPSKEVTVVYDASKNDAEGLVKGFAKKIELSLLYGGSPARSEGRYRQARGNRGPNRSREFHQSAVLKGK